MQMTRSTRLLFAFCLLFSGLVHAGPSAQPGDVGLRHDIQLLADYGAIRGPVTTWPISWDALLADLERVKDEDIVLPNAVMPTYERLLSRAQRQTGVGVTTLEGRISIAEEPIGIRGFANTPREQGEVGGHLAWVSEHLSLDLNVSYVDDPADGDEVRADGSQIGVNFGNWEIAASSLDRWWGPGWDGSLILSNNARPIPSLTIGRNLTKPFETRWLSWMGPWDLNFIFGQLENERVVADARFFGARLNFRPIQSLEIGISRTAQWCGDGRPCGLDTLLDLLVGKDNVGDSGVTPENEPGNQLAGFDVRWTNMWFRVPVSLYGQMIGEDEAGGFPSRYLVQFGVEVSGILRDQMTYRWFAELTGTSCDFVKSEVLYNCAYRNGIYQSGYTYKRKIIGHGLDNDSDLVSAGLVLSTAEGNLWQIVGRVGDVNKVGSDSQHSVAVVPQELSSIDVSHTRNSKYGRFEIGLGYERREISAGGQSSSDARGYIRWTGP